MRTPGGRVGTVMATVSYPNRRWHLSNQANSFHRLCRNWMPFPTRGRVFGGFLEWGVSRFCEPKLNLLLESRHPCQGPLPAHLKGSPLRLIVFFFLPKARVNNAMTTMANA